MLAAITAMIIASTGAVVALTAIAKVWLDRPRRASPAATPITQGMTVAFDGGQTITALQELAAEREQHGRCDVLLSRHDIDIPHE